MITNTTTMTGLVLWRKVSLIEVFAPAGLMSGLASTAARSSRPERQLSSSPRRQPIRARQFPQRYATATAAS
jgi:hypothetical protein